MKICVTGGAGMIGSNLVNRLTSEGHNVSVIDNLWRGKLEYLQNVSGFDTNRDFHDIDISLDSNIPAIIKVLNDVDCIIHLADIVAGIGYVFSNQYDIFVKNIKINQIMFHCAKSVNVNKLVYVGTACSFPKDLQVGLNSILHEDQLYPAQPESAYGWSKLVGQLELDYLKECTDIDVATLMLHNVYGKNCEFEGNRTQVIPSLINKIVNSKDGDVIDVWGTGEQGRAFIHVDDVVNALFLATTKKHLPAEIQIGPAVCTSIKELVTHLITISGKDLSIHFDKSKPEGDKGRSANFSRATEYLGWEPSVSLESGLKETYDWIYKQMKS